MKADVKENDNQIPRTHFNFCKLHIYKLNQTPAKPLPVKKVIFSECSRTALCDRYPFHRKEELCVTAVTHKPWEQAAAAWSENCFP